MLYQAFQKACRWIVIYGIQRQNLYFKMIATYFKSQITVLSITKVTIRIINSLWTDVDSDTNIDWLVLQQVNDTGNK